MEEPLHVRLGYTRGFVNFGLDYCQAELHSYGPEPECRPGHFSASTSSRTGELSTNEQVWEFCHLELLVGDPDAQNSKERCIHEFGHLESDAVIGAIATSRQSVTWTAVSSSR